MRQIFSICLKYSTAQFLCKPFDQFEFLNERHDLQELQNYENQERLIDVFVIV